MLAALVAAIGNVHMNVERNAQAERFRMDLSDQTHAEVPPFCVGNADSERSSMPFLASLSAKSVASWSAVSRSTSYSLQILSTISSSGVCPSASSQMKVAISFNENKVEVLNDATSISPSSFREAVSSLWLMKSGK